MQRELYESNPLTYKHGLLLVSIHATAHSSHHTNTLARHLLALKTNLNELLIIDSRKKSNSVI